MGKLVPFKKPAGPQRESPDTSDASRDFNIAFVDESGKTTGFATLELDPAVKIQLFLNGLKGDISKQAAVDARNSLRGFTLEQLEEIARDSTEADWATKPAYFQELSLAITRSLIRTIEDSAAHDP